MAAITALNNRSWLIQVRVSQEMLLEIARARGARGVAATRAALATGTALSPIDPPPLTPGSFVENAALYLVRRKRA